MKNRIKAPAIAVAAMVALSGCDGLLDVDNPNALVEESIKLEAAANGVVNGSLNRISNGISDVWEGYLVASDELALPDIVEGWGVSTATLNLGARNLKLWMPGSEYPGMDPETNVGGRCNGGLNCNFLNSTEGWAIPLPRRLTFSTRVTF